MMQKRFGAGLAAAALLISAGHCAAQAPASPPDPVHIGLVQSLFIDLPDPLVGVLMKPFGGLMRDLTGLNGQAASAGDAFAIGQKLKDGQLHLGVFQGFEFAWAQQKYPKLKPLMIAVYYDRHLRASVIVRADSDAKQVADLRGKELAMPIAIKGHCRLFLQRHCTDANGPCEPKAFFKQVARPEHAEAALDMVLDRQVQGAVVDDVSLACYQGVKSGPAKRLRVLKKSEVFPAGVIAYYDNGALDEATLGRFKKGLLDATGSPRARELMSLFKITSFEDIPDDYAQTLADIVRAYPPPHATAATAAKTATGN
jgi:ABC-type phosphate/phosphonate transport system substrate-binding protein